MRSYVTFFSLRIAIREGAAILAGYAVGFHDYFSFFIRITAYGEAWVSRGLMVESHNFSMIFGGGSECTVLSPTSISRRGALEQGQGTEPPTAPGRRSIGCPLLRVCVHGVCVCTLG